MARSAITFDGATTENVRELAASLARHGHKDGLSVHLDGPDKWGGFTEKLPAATFAKVLADLLSYNDLTPQPGQKRFTVANALDDYRNLKVKQYKVLTEVNDALQVFADNDNEDKVVLEEVKRHLLNIKRHVDD